MTRRVVSPARRTRRAIPLAVLTFVASAAFAIFTGYAPFALASGTFSCSNTIHDFLGAEGTTNPTGLDGVQGSIYVPKYSAADLNGQITTAADVADFVIDGHYFQLGWYVGSTGTGLPYVTTPHVWAGEGLENSWETLTDIGPIGSLGAYYNFDLFRNEDTSSPDYNHYQARFNGDPVSWTSSMANGYSAYPWMVGESNYDCASMLGIAASGSGGGNTLELHHAGGAWATWQQHEDVAGGNPVTDPSCWTNTTINGNTATVEAEEAC